MCVCLRCVGLDGFYMLALCVDLTSFWGAGVSKRLNTDRRGTQALVVFETAFLLHRNSIANFIAGQNSLQRL